MILSIGRSIGFCMLCELQRHVLRTFGHNQNEAIKPMAIIQKLKCKYRNVGFSRYHLTLQIGALIHTLKTSLISHGYHIF